MAVTAESTRLSGCSPGLSSALLLAAPPPVQSPRVPSEGCRAHRPPLLLLVPQQLLSKGSLSHTVSALRGRNCSGTACRRRAVVSSLVVARLLWFA